MSELSREELQVERIEKYLNGRLSQEERMVFEQEMASNENLQTQVEAYRKLFSGFRAKELDAVKDRMQHWEAARPKQRTSTRNLRWYAAAAAVLLLIVAIPFLVPSHESMGPEELFAAHFQPFQSDLGQRNQAAPVTDSLVQQLNQALDAYHNGEMVIAIEILEKHLLSASALTNRELANIRLMLGSAFLATEQATNAVRQFEIVENDPDYQEHGQWYKALTFLLMGQKKQAEEILSILAKNPYYRKEAENILSNLKNN